MKFHRSKRFTTEFDLPQTHGPATYLPSVGVAGRTESVGECGRQIVKEALRTTLAQEVRVVLGDANDDLIARTHELIREYWSKGVRLGNKYGDIPEIGMTSFALNGRLTWNHKTTLAKEVEKVLGPKTKPLTLPKIKSVVQIYQRKGIRLHRKCGRIPELDMSSHNLADRLQRNFKVKLSELVDEVANRNSR